MSCARPRPEAEKLGQRRRKIAHAPRRVIHVQHKSHLNEGRRKGSVGSVGDGFGVGFGSGSLAIRRLLSQPCQRRRRSCQRYRHSAPGSDPRRHPGGRQQRVLGRQPANEHPLVFGKRILCHRLTHGAPYGCHARERRKRRWCSSGAAAARLAKCDRVVGELLHTLRWRWRRRRAEEFCECARGKGFGDLGGELCLLEVRGWSVGPELDGRRRAQLATSYRHERSTPQPQNPCRLAQIHVGRPWLARWQVDKPTSSRDCGRDVPLALATLLGLLCVIGHHPLVCARIRRHRRHRGRIALVVDRGGSKQSTERRSTGHGGCLRLLLLLLLL